MRWCAWLLVGLATAAALAGGVRDELSRPLELDPAKISSRAAARGGEVYHMRWKLGGFLGLLAGLFVPNDGDVLLTFVPSADQRLEVGVLVTAPKRDGEYFVYGAEIDRRSGTTAAVWSSYVFRNRGKDREQEIDEPDVIDYASAIYRLRWDPPEKPVRMTIWDLGRTYPAEVVPMGIERRKIEGRKVEVRGYEVHGVKIKNQPSFDDKIWLYFTTGEEAIPVEIVGKRGWMRVSMRLRDVDGATQQARGDRE